MEGGFDDVDNERPEGKFNNALAGLAAIGQATRPKGNYPFAEEHAKEASPDDNSEQDTFQNCSV